MSGKMAPTRLRHLTDEDYRKIHEEFTNKRSQQTGEYLRLYREQASGEQPTVKRQVIQRPTTQPLHDKNIETTGYDIAIEETMRMPVVQLSLATKAILPTKTDRHDLRLIGLPIALDRLVQKFYFEHQRMPGCIYLHPYSIYLLASAGLLQEANYAFAGFCFRELIPVLPDEKLNTIDIILNYDDPSHQKVG
jgi:hypothetical protein